MPYGLSTCQIHCCAGIKWRSKVDINILSKFKIYPRGNDFYIAHNGEYLKIYEYLYSTQPYHWGRGNGIYVAAEASSFVRGKEYLPEDKMYYQFTYPTLKRDSYKPYWGIADTRTIWGSSRYQSYLKECGLNCMIMMYYIYSKPSEPYRFRQSRRHPKFIIPNGRLK